MPAKKISSLHMNTERTWRGGEKQALLLMQGLQEKGHLVHLVCPPQCPLHLRAEAAGIHVIPLHLRGEINPKVILSLKKILKAHPYDILHMHTSHAHAQGVLARAFKKLPKTVVSRRVDFSIHRRFSMGMNWLKYKFGVDQYVAISHAIKKVMISDGIAENRIEMVHSGVNKLAESSVSREELRSKHSIPPEAKLIGNIAHLASHKGHVSLVKAFQKLAGRNTNLHLMIVGEGGEREKIEAQISQCPEFSKRVHLAGFQEDVAKYFQAFDIFTMPSTLEGLCTSLIDALHFALPTVASKTGGIPELIKHGETGLLSPVDDSESLASCLQELLNDWEQATKYGLNGQRLVRDHFSVEAMVSGNLELYKKLLKQQDS